MRGSITIQWVEEHYGKPLIIQMPEAMCYPIGESSFNYMMIYPDRVRIDLSFRFKNAQMTLSLLLFCSIKTIAEAFYHPLPVPSGKY
jgi:aminoglycoside 6-adenylyltransferase